MAGPSHQERVGKYLGESGRSLSERAGDHYMDARDFNKKSHILKHWMNIHREDNVIPQFRIRVLKQVQDCLSRQVEEVVAIHMSKDSLLNSKNKYVANCINRVWQDGHRPIGLRLKV